MKIIDSVGLPEEILILLNYDDYDYENTKGTITTTTFTKPTQEIVLTERYYDKIEVEASTRLWSVLGSAVHSLLEKALKRSNIDCEVEQRLSCEVCGQKVSGKFDLVRNNTIKDYKTTSAWSNVFGSKEDDYKSQLSINRYLYYKVNGKLLDDVGEIVAIYRDWSASKVSGNYPTSPFEVQKIELLSIEDTEKLITDKIKEIEENRLSVDLLPCTDEQRWKGFDKKKKCDVYRKCQSYCNVSKFCKQWEQAKLVNLDKRED